MRATTEKVKIDSGGMYLQHSQAFMKVIIEIRKMIIGIIIEISFLPFTKVTIEKDNL